MPKFIDRTGQRFGRLIVLQRVGRTAYQKIVWRCLCSCGQETIVSSGSLASGNTVSCGCYLKERITKHGGYGKPSFNSWRAMIRRCTISTDKDYPRYGAVGVTVCPEWLDYKVFAADMGEPEGKETLDRIDPYGGYSKTNCRWASPVVQARNIRTRKSSKSGVNGVVKIYNGKWMASITAGRKRYYSQVFSTVEEAAAARKELELLHWGVV
jgi:hypothetical protein